MTLYVVPALYLLIARNTRSPEYMSRLIEGLVGEERCAWRAATAGRPPAKRADGAAAKSRAAFDIARDMEAIRRALSTPT